MMMMTTTTTDDNREKITVNGYDYQIYQLKPNRYAVNVLPGTFNTKEAAVAALMVYIQQSDRTESERPAECKCRLEPVNDTTEQCDLCSEATETFNGIGWKIVHCSLHRTAVNNFDALVGALEKARYALKEVAKETRFSGHGLSFPLTVQEIDAALAAVRRN